ncbi:hypothetical protein EJB05_27852, partial [Eragrostis curvula]
MPSLTRQTPPSSGRILLVSRGSVLGRPLVQPTLTLICAHQHWLSMVTLYCGWPATNFPVRATETWSSDSMQAPGRSVIAWQQSTAAARKRMTRINDFETAVYDLYTGRTRSGPSIAEGLKLPVKATM